MRQTMSFAVLGRRDGVAHAGVWGKMRTLCGLKYTVVSHSWEEIDVTCMQCIAAEKP